MEDSNVPVNLADAPELVTPGDFGEELAAFIRAMRANNVSPNTILAYGGAVRQFGTWLMENGYPTVVADIEPRHVELWIASILEKNKPATAHNRWRGLQRFFNWYKEVEDDFRSPMEKLHPPRLPKMMPRVLTIEQIAAIVGTCQGSTFEEHRDNALLRILFDTGARRHEVAALRYDEKDPADRDVDVNRRWVRVFGKGGKDNLIALTDSTLTAYDNYIRARRKHAHASLPWLWLGRRGELTDSGIAQIVRERGMRAGIPNLHPHDFRHAATHHELIGGMNEADVMNKRGWDSPAMLRRYASTTANERAIAASRKLGLGDKI
jgi:site-specific recombinase XerD